MQTKNWKKHKIKKSLNCDMQMSPAWQSRQNVFKAIPIPNELFFKLLFIFGWNDEI